MKPSRTVCSALCVTTIRSKVKSKSQIPDLTTFERTKTRGVSLSVRKRYTSTTLLIKQRMVKISHAESELQIKLARSTEASQEGILTR